MLADMVEAAGAFYVGGGTLTPPATVSKSTAEYRVDQDIIGQFFAARKRVRTKGATVWKAKDLYAAFLEWWKSEGHCEKKAPSSTKFGTLAKRKVGFQRGNAGVVYHIRLMPLV